PLARRPLPWPLSCSARLGSLRRRLVRPRGAAVGLWTTENRNPCRDRTQNRHFSRLRAQHHHQRRPVPPLSRGPRAIHTNPSASEGSPALPAAVSGTLAGAF